MRGLPRLSRDGAVRRVVTDSGWALGTTAVTTLAGFIEVVLLAHYLGPSGLGIFVLLIAYPEAVQQLLDFRVRDGLTKYLAGFLAQGRKRDAVAMLKLTWALDVAVSAIALVIVLATAGLVAGTLVDDSDRGSLMMIYAVGLFFGSLDTASGTVLRVLDRFALSFAAGAGSAVVRLALVGGAVAAGGGLETLIWARAGAELATTLIQGSAGLAALRGVVGAERDAPISELRDRYREIGRFLLSTNVYGLVRTAGSKLDTILVGLIATPATVGLYRVALQFGRLPLLVGDSLYSVVYPRLARAFARQQMADMRRLCLRATGVMAAVGLPVGVLFALEGDAVLRIAAGEAFGDAHAALALCLVGVIPYVLFFWAPSVILASGHAGALVPMTLVGTVAQLAAIALLVPGLGADGAGAAFALSYLIATVLQLRFIRRRRLLDGGAPAVPAAAATAP